MVEPVRSARTEWRNGVLWSLDYDDLYAQAQNPRQESLEIFLNGNYLPERWRLQPQFVLAETGFGTGRNFLNCVRHFCGDHLTYISTELHPLRTEQLREIHRGTELQNTALELADHWPQHLPGAHYLYPFRHIELILLFGDSAEQLTQRQDPVNAWFLDGFSPAKNPDMWSSRLLQQVARMSQCGTTLSTYSAAGELRRQLQSLGFQVKKRPGIAGKRESIQAIYLGASNT